MLSFYKNIFPTIKLITLMALLMLAESAQAAASNIAPQNIDPADKVGMLTTGAASRARADVAIRRIKILMVSSSAADQEQAIEQIQAIQKNLRGEIRGEK